jgi:dTDP-4-dehydrorhamnose reductase
LRILVTGAGGLLGGRLAASLHAQGFEVLAAHRRTAPPPGPRALAGELLDEGEVERLLDAEQPEAVLHAAVLGRADLCQERPAEARATNAELPGRLARACAARGIRLVALSTDLVFGGDAAPYRETDAPRPPGVYGQTKHAGEQAVLDAFPAAAVARVALVLGRGHGTRGSATESVAWALSAGRPVRLFTDEHRTPIDPESVADAARRLLTGTARGLFHLGGPERLSRYELGLRVARLLGLPEADITPARQSDYTGSDPRAPDVSLDNTRARRELGWEPRALDAAIRDARQGPA